MRITIAWTLNAYIYFMLIITLLIPVITKENIDANSFKGFLFATVFYLLLCSIINKLIVKKFFPYPKGEFVNQLTEEFKKQRLSERIYISIRNALIPGIIFIVFGTIVNTQIRGRNLDYMDLIIIGTPLCLILILRILFTIYQKDISRRKDTESIK